MSDFPSELDCSIVMLLESEEAGFVTTLLEVHEYFSNLGYSHELILLVNGPGHFAKKCLKEWPYDAPDIKLVEFSRRIYSGVGLQTTVEECRGDFLYICGPYQQVDYPDQEKLIRSVASGEVDLAIPWRKNRVDPLINQIQSWLFNWLVRFMTKVQVHDLSCALRVVSKRVFSEIILYGDLYRYLPLLAQSKGYKISELPVAHIEERGKVGFLGLRTYLIRFVDLCSMHFVYRFVRKPLRYFGLRGMILFCFGFISMLAAVLLRITANVGLGDSSLLMAGLLLMVAGSSICGIGLLGEIIAFTFGRKQKDYLVETIQE